MGQQGEATLGCKAPIQGDQIVKEFFCFKRDYILILTMFLPTNYQTEPPGMWEQTQPCTSPGKLKNCRATGNNTDTSLWKGDVASAYI